MIDPEAVRKVIIIGISNYRDTQGAPGSVFEPGSWVAVSSLRLAKAPVHAWTEPDHRIFGTFRPSSANL
jgi:hypothetical protein